MTSPNEFNITLDQKLAILGDFEAELASLSDEERDEQNYPEEKVINLARKFLLMTHNVLSRFIRASEDGRGGIILIFSSKLEVSISEDLKFFVCPNFGSVENIYTFKDIHQLIRAYFPDEVIQVVRTSKNNFNLAA